MPVRALVWNNKNSNGIHLLPAERLAEGDEEFALMRLGYNIRRAKNMFGYKK